MMRVGNFRSKPSDLDYAVGDRPNDVEDMLREWGVMPSNMHTMIRKQQPKAPQTALLPEENEYLRSVFPDMYRQLEKDGAEIAAEHLADVPDPEILEAGQDDMDIEVNRIYWDTLYNPSNRATHRVLYGGRAGGKSWAVADFWIYKARTETFRALLCREYCKTIEDSLYPLIEERIHHYGLQDEFEFTPSKAGVKIRHRGTGAGFVFAGLRTNFRSLRSGHKFKYVWVEEASYVSYASIRDLMPTVSRNPGAMLVWTFNPRYITDAVYQMFLMDKAEADRLGIDARLSRYRKNAYVREVSYLDNHYLSSDTPENRVFWEELESMREHDPEEYQYVYGGGIFQRSDSLIYKASNWKALPRDKVAEFEARIPKHAAVLLGADFGDVNPSTIVEVLVWDHIVYVRNCHGAPGLSNEGIAAMYDRIPTARTHLITADSAEPKTIRALKGMGFNIRGTYKSSKGQGYVREGIRGVKKHFIFIHPDCKGVLREILNYRFKTHKDNEMIVLDEIVKADDHFMDALRYALEPIILPPPSTLRSIGGGLSLKQD